MVITSDASKMGWGATFGNLSTNGRWSKQESDLHINVLELNATFLISDTSFSEKSVESSGETPSRQHNSSDVCQQPRRDSITQSHVVDTRTVELVATTQHSDHCRTPPGCLQCPGRQRVANIYRFQRLETTTRNNTIFPQGQRDRSLRHKTDQSIKELCELATRPTCCGDGRFFNRLKSDERICVSTIQSHPTDINEGYKRQCEHSASSTSVANSTLVPLLLQLTVQLPVLLPASPTLLQDPSNPKAIHPMYPRLRLAVWTISNNSAQQQTFRTQLPAFCPRLHFNLPTNHMTVHGQNGTAGVIEGKLIQFQPLSKTFRLFLVTSSTITYSIVL